MSVKQIRPDNLSCILVVGFSMYSLKFYLVLFVVRWQYCMSVKMNRTQCVLLFALRVTLGCVSDTSLS